MNALTKKTIILAAEKLTLENKFNYIGGSAVIETVHSASQTELFLCSESGSWSIGYGGDNIVKAGEDEAEDVAEGDELAEHADPEEDGTADGEVGAGGKGAVLAGLDCHAIV
jgi:hypothetical protein